MKKNKFIFLSVLVVLFVGVGCFYGGFKYQQSRTVTAVWPANNQGEIRTIGQSGGNQRRINNSGEAINGEIIGQDDKSITLKLRDGGSKIIFLSEQMEINKSVIGQMEDLKIGELVIVTGTANNDGSVTAKLIQLRQLPTIQDIK